MECNVISRSVATMLPGQCKGSVYLSSLLACVALAVGSILLTKLPAHSRDTPGTLLPLSEIRDQLPDTVGSPVSEKEPVG